jgi:hypothetical protein
LEVKIAHSLSNKVIVALSQSASTQNAGNVTSINTFANCIYKKTGDKEIGTYAPVGIVVRTFTDKSGSICS